MVDCTGVVVKAQDLLSPSGKRTNKYYEQIKNAGGIHEYFGSDIPVILSSIMPDKMLYGFSIQAYVDMIDDLQPDFYYTPDGETYLGEEWISGLEISRIMTDTRYLIRSFSHIRPIGLVKGCNVGQVAEHTNQLLGLGVSRYAFHTGDYICRGSASAVKQAIYFASTIRKKVPWLIVNGVGAMSTLKNFNFADGYVTQNHFVEAYYGCFCDPDRHENEKRTVSRDDIMKILQNVQRNVSAIQLQKSLTEWLFSEGELVFEHFAVSDGSMNPEGGI